MRHERTIADMKTHAAIGVHSNFVSQAHFVLWLPRSTITSKHIVFEFALTAFDILVDCKVAPFSDLVLDFTLTHPRTGSSNKYPIGSWKPDALGMANSKETKKHALSYEQAQHAFLSLTADTYGKISDDFVRFLWMMATAASTNFRLSQPSPNSEPSLSQDTFTKLRGSLYSRFRVQIAAAIAKAAAARFVPDSTNNGIPTFVVWDRGRKPLTNSAPEHDLPLYHIPCT